MFNLSLISTPPFGMVLVWMGVAVMMLGASLTGAGEEDGAVPAARIARFSGDKDAAISFTVDDGFKGATDELTKAFEPFGFKVTWYVNPGPTTEDMTGYKGRTMWPQWRALRDAGHEIGNHGLTHANLTQLEAQAAAHEIDEAYAQIEKHLGAPPFSYCPAYGARNEAVDALIAVKHRAQTGARLFYGGDKWTLEKANRWVDAAIAKKEWIVPMLHSYSKGYAEFKEPGAFDTHLQYVKEHEARLWVAPFATVSKYVRLRDASKLESRPVAGGVELTLSSELDTRIFDRPLTVVVDAPGAVRAEAKRTGRSEPIPARVAEHRILVDLLPGPEPVTVSWSK
ncbi:MAG: hypothetical protein AMXMBFR7_28440 [Planctomycetota bacterium]